MTEFTNIVYDIEKTLRHCFRQQAARCHEYVLYEYRTRKLHDPTSEAPVKTITFVSSAGWSKEPTFSEKHFENWTEDEQKIIVVKYGRVFEAKRLFERLGGDYKNFQ